MNINVHNINGSSSLCMRIVIIRRQLSHAKGSRFEREGQIFVAVNEGHSGGCVCMCINVHMGS